MSKNIITELSKKETALLEKYIKAKEEKKKAEDSIESMKGDIINLLEAKEGKIIYDGRNITLHEDISYLYSDAIKNIETEIKVLKRREETLGLAVVNRKTKYAKIYELKK